MVDLNFVSLLGVRSVSFKDSVVTIGTGHGSVFFYDLNSKQYLKKYGRIHCLKSGKGWLVSQLFS